MAQRITAEEAAALIQDNMALGVGGFGAYAAPDELLSALAERYERLGSPRALTAVCGISPGSNRPDGRGLARLRAPGLLDTVMAGHFANPPEIAELIGTNQVAAYALPLGVMLHLWRAIAGHKPAVLTHVGLGTFRPVKAEDISEHEMHSEYCMIPEETARTINETKRNGGRVICVGTTSCRTVESFAAEDGTLKESAGWTSIFIYPGYRFKVLDALVTNFHLPQSTLIMLVSALAGREHVLSAYEEAVKERYRFFSFGDAMFIS